MTRCSRAFDAGGLPFAIPDIGLLGGAAIFLFFIFGFLFYAGLFAAVGATVNSEQEAQQAQMPVVLLLLLSVMFLQNILMDPDGMLSVVLSTLPFSAPIVMPMRLSMGDVPTVQLVGSLGSVIAGGDRGHVARVADLSRGAADVRQAAERARDPALGVAQLKVQRAGSGGSLRVRPGEGLCSVWRGRAESPRSARPRRKPPQVTARVNRDRGRTTMASMPPLSRAVRAES